MTKEEMTLLGFEIVAYAGMLVLNSWRPSRRLRRVTSLKRKAW